MRHLAPTPAICQPRPGCALRTRTARARPSLFPPPAAPLPSPPGPLPQPPLPGGPVWGTKEPASALSGRTFPAARRTRPLRFELGPERRAPSRAAAPYPSPAGQPRTWGRLGKWRPSGPPNGSGLRRNPQSSGIPSDPLFLLRPPAPCPSLYCRDNSLKAAQSCQRFGFPLVSGPSSQRLGRLAARLASSD